jgi:hypothetical protein
VTFSFSAKRSVKLTSSKLKYGLLRAKLRGAGNQGSRLQAHSPHADLNWR